MCSFPHHFLDNRTRSPRLVVLGVDVGGYVGKIVAAMERAWDHHTNNLTPGESPKNIEQKESAVKEVPFPRIV